MIEAAPIATRSGQVVLYRLSDAGRSVCLDLGIDPGPNAAPSLEHAFWVRETAACLRHQGYDVAHEHAVPGNGLIDILAERPGERVAVEIETGRSDIQENIEKLRPSGFDKLILVATSPSAIAACQKAIQTVEGSGGPAVELWTWLDIC